MSRTRATYFASNNQPRLVVERLLTLPHTLRLLHHLRAGGHSAAELDATDGEARTRLRQLCRVNLVTAYQIGEQWRYRRRRLPPYVTQALRSLDVAAA